jgi:hypothetical protein
MRRPFSPSHLSGDCIEACLDVSPPMPLFEVAPPLFILQ